MDRELMKKYYMNMHEDAVGEAVKDDEDYSAASDERKRLEDELIHALEQFAPSLLPLYDKLSSETSHLESIISLDSYLLGAADRERMLR